MERMSDRHLASLDLADIVLADRDAREHKQLSNRERGAWRAQVHDRRNAMRSGYDAASVAIMALVVLAIAVILGFAVSAIRGPEEALPGATAPTKQSAAGATEKPAAATEPKSSGASTGEQPPATPVKLVPGVQLAVGRVTAKPVRDGSGSVVINARVNDIGTKLPASGQNVMVIAVLDGEVVGARPLQLEPVTAGRAAASGTAMVSFRTDSCSSGTHSVSIIVDSTGVVPEANEADNARSTQLEWAC